MLIRLEYQGRTLHEVAFDEMAGELTIGRGKPCDWRVAGEDPVVSSRHAALTRKGKALWIADLQSKNGIFLRGKKIERRRLKEGDQVGIGNHLLCVDRSVATDNARAASQVRVLSGKSRGRRQPLLPPVLTIGSDPACNLVLLDGLVSKRHAEIAVKEDGACWIRDLGSKNGTTVNGLPLREEKERLLKDGDRIGLAHLELEFQDGAARRSGSQAWLRLGVVAATLVVALGLYGAWMMMRPSAETYLDRARNLAAAQDFDAARRELEHAENARGAARHEARTRELRRSLGVWENTLRQWAAARKALERGDWVESARRLGMLQSERTEAWSWNASGAAEKNAADRVKTLLDLRLGALGALRREDAAATLLQESRSRIAEALSALPGGGPAHLEKLTEELRTAAAALDRALEQTQTLERALELLRRPFPPYPEIVAALETVVRSPESAVRRRAARLEEPVRALAAAFSVLNRQADALRAMEFEQAMDETAFALPTPEACAADIRVSEARGALERIHGRLRAAAAQTAHRHKTIRDLMGGDTSALPGLDLLENAEKMRQVFACDTLQFEIPRRTRKEPVGEYDRLLGVEEFYLTLRLLPEKPDAMMAMSWPFPSLLTRTEDALRRIAEMNAFLNEPDNLWLLGGRLADEMKRLNRFRARADAVVAAMLQEAARRTGRERLMAGGIAYKLASDAAALTMENKPLARWLADETKALRATVAEMAAEYRRAAPVRQIEIRERMLRLGLPGDPSLRGMWVMQTSAP
jgi:pSer/pThr/pTyr-binding forkhead associated (FHA) protein